jgi:plasmid stabilization system protein ParE
VVKKIIWTPKAEKSFDSVISYLEGNWSEREVINFIQRVTVLVRHIERFPLSYPEAGKEDTRQALITKQNLLLYRISGNVYFWDTRQNPMKKTIH